MTETLSLFKQLTSVPTAPYYESAVTAKALAWIKKKLGREVSVSRRRGGVIVRYQGAPGAAALALAAHLDHPAFHLDGARAEMQGNLAPHLMPGFPIEAFSAKPRDNKPRGRGVLEATASEKVFRVRWTQPPSGPVAFATLALPPCEIGGGWLASRSIDDLLGCAVSLETLRLAVKKKWKTNVTVLLHRAEEVGFIGALDLIHEGAISKDDTVLSIETSREMPGARPGKGPVIRLGDKASLFDPNATALLDQAASRLKRPIQRLRLTGGTCEATAYLGFGYEAGGVAIPLVNYHNGLRDGAVAAEKVRLSDIDGAVALLLETARVFPELTLRGALRRRLTKLHGSHKFGKISP